MRREEVAFGSVADLTFRFRHNKASHLQHFGKKVLMEKTLILNFGWMERSSKNSLLQVRNYASHFLWITYL
jgi:hypothetical protein